jgi:hypothetical protein
MERRCASFGNLGVSNLFINYLLANLATVGSLGEPLCKPKDDKSQSLALRFTLRSKLCLKA